MATNLDIIFYKWDTYILLVKLIVISTFKKIYLTNFLYHLIRFSIGHLWSFTIIESSKVFDLVTNIERLLKIFLTAQTFISYIIFSLSKLLI